MFAEADADDSGYLDRAEVARLCKDMGKHLGKKELAAAFDKMDTDGSGRIEFDEFDRWWSAECGRKASRRKAEDEIDVTSLVDIVVDGPELTLQADGEGYILRADSEDEAQRWVRALRLVWRG